MSVSAAATAYKVRSTPLVFSRKVHSYSSLYSSRLRNFKIEVHPNAGSLSRGAADRIVDQAATKKGTVLTPGCNTPLEMYRVLGQRAKERGVDLVPLLMGKEGGFHMGMIDGVECSLEHPYSFPYYFAQHFLRYLGFYPPCATKDPAEKKFLIDSYFSLMLKNVRVPWIPREASEQEKLSYVHGFNQWLIGRQPIDLIICGIGPDGHIAFLGRGQEHLKLPAARVKLWEGVRDWKWGNPTDAACVCTREGSCGSESQVPEHALTISLGTMLKAKRVILMAIGESKAAAISKLVKDPYDPQGFIAQYLRDAGGEITILLDEGSASLL